MKKVAAAAAAAAAVLVMAAFAGLAFAGDHASPPGHDHHSSGSASKNTASSDSQPGQKPGSHTQKNTDCTSGGDQATCTSTTSSKPDASKRYGNGKTAAQIANDKGAPSGTDIHGPGNSQPHKICGRDVHAYGTGNGSKCGEQQSPPKSQEQQQQQQVTFCDMSSSTTGDLQTKNASEVANHEFNGSWEENRDIVPPFTYNGKSYSENWPSGEAIFNAGCRGSSGEQGTTTVEQPDHGKVYVCHATGSATNPYVLIHISFNGWLNGHSHHQDDRDILLGDKPGPCPTGPTVTTIAAGTSTALSTTTTTTTSTTTAQSTPTAQSTTTAGTTTTTAAAVIGGSNGTPNKSSGVLGATKTIASPAATHHPASGVLGTVTSGTLPFTGIRLWIVELFALGLIGLGVGTRIFLRGRA